MVCLSSSFLPSSTSRAFLTPGFHRAGLPEKLITYARWKNSVSKSANRTVSLVFGQQLCQVGTRACFTTFAVRVTVALFCTGVRARTAQGRSDSCGVPDRPCVRPCCARFVSFAETELRQTSMLVQICLGNVFI